MNKKIFVFISMVVLCLISVNAETNFTSLNLVGERTRQGVNFYYSGEDVSLNAIYSEQTNVDFYCVSDVENYDTCTRNSLTSNNLTGCILYTLNDSSSPVTIIDSDTWDSGKYTIYCQLCNQSGYCDNSTISGNNYVSFYVSNFGSLSSLILGFLGILSITAVIMGMMGVTSSISKKFNIKVVIGGVILALVGVLLLYQLIYGF